jgi:hypothetical protein
MSNDLQPSSVAGPVGESSAGNPEGDSKAVYWHRELPPLDAEPMGEHTVEANSMRVAGGLTHGGDPWDQCYRDLMIQAHLRLGQEVHRLGGDYAHVLGEAIGSRHDDRSREVWLRGCITYLLLRRPGER